ncbi:MAG: serine hydrolase domain-containing protein [Vicinamibacterales bacterium]
MRRTLLRLFVALAALASARPFDAAQGPPDPHAGAWERVAELATARMREANTPGLALAITSRDRLLHVATFGFANLAARRRLTPDTLFEIGSVSKSFTAIALLQLRDEGRFDPHAPIARYLPWFSVRSSYAPITGHHLMSHTSGLPRDRDDVPSSRYQAYGVRDREAGYAPGVHYAYSNVGYQVLGYALESIEHQPYADVIAQRILGPLGMQASAARFTHETRPRLAVGYARLYDDRPSHPAHPLVPATWLEYAAGDGSIVSTPADMAAYARMLLNRGAGPGGRRVLSDEGFRLLTGRAIPSGEKAWYGYGMSTSERGGRAILSHSGGMVGYASMLVADPEAGVAAVVFVNGPGNPGSVARFAVDVARAALRGEALPPLPEPTDPAVIDNAADFAGTYMSGQRTLVLKADAPLLGTPLLGRLALLERRGRDVFYLNDPAWYTFLLRFEREHGAVIGFSHGGDWFSRSDRRAPASPPHPPEWNAYPGHYRTTHAWFNNFRIVLRRGALYLVPPDGGETKMEPLGSGLFKEGGLSAERLRFDSIVEGQALRANLSGVDYYRVFTP